MTSSKQNVAYFSDLTLLRRVEKYLEENVDVNKEEMVEDLRNFYKEYLRRNRSAFKATVFKAYDILRTKNLDKDDGATDELEVTRCEEVESDDELVDTSANLIDNSASKSTSKQSYLENIQSMANRGIPKKRQNNTQELISIISSDEEEPKRQREKSPKKFVFDPKNFPDLNIKETSTPYPPYNPKKRKHDSQKRKKEIIPDPIPSSTYADFGGYPKIIETVNNLLLHFYQHEMFALLGVAPPRGFLLHGPPGSGKTHLAHCIAGELQFALVSIAAPELVGGMSGESEKKIRELFQRAKEQVPCVLFIDEIDVICQSRESSRKEMEKRIVSQLIASLDELNECEEGLGMIVIGATNRLEVIDPALRRAGRFDKEVCLGIPSRMEREGILKVMCSKVKIDKEIPLLKLAELTPGYVAADLKALILESAVVSINRLLEAKKQISNGDEKTESPEKNDCDIIEIVDKTNFRLASIMDQEELAKFNIEMQDILKALKNVQPSSKREGFATVPDVTWDDIGSLKDIRQELKMSIMMPVKYPNEFIKMGVDAPSGILLCGPPGCGKTLLAKAVANEANINFISVKGPELLNMYVGESERAVRQCFQRARNSQPCVIFFDEIDALCPKRSDTTEGTVSSRMVNQVLTEMDGVEGREGVFLMAATNRPDMIDPAVLRPGRFDKILFVGLPSPSDRVDILKTITKNGTKPPLAVDVLLDEIGASRDLDGYSGADLAALVKEASVLALTEYINILEGPQEEMTPIEAKELIVQVKHFNQAIAKIRPSVNPKDQKRYEHLKNLYGQPNDDTEMDIETEAVS